MKPELRILRIIACLLAAILLVLTQHTFGGKVFVAIFIILAITLPIGLFPISRNTDDKGGTE